MKLVIIRAADMLDDAGTRIRGLDGNTTVIGTGKEKDNLVQVTFAGQTGWVDKSRIAEFQRLDINEKSFVRECIIAERTFNDLDETSPYYVLADYLIARAFLETGIKNEGRKIDGSDAVGPLQVSSDEWKSFRTGGHPLANGFDDDDFDSYLDQVWGAAYTMHAIGKAISEARLAAGVGKPDDRPLASYLEIHIAYLTGAAKADEAAKAAIALSDGAATPKDKGDDAAGAGPNSGAKLNAFLKADGGLSEDQIATMFKRRASLTGSNDANAKTVGEFVASVSTALNGALGEAFKRVSKHAPEAIVPAGQGPAPWLQVANGELGTAEGTAAGDARIAQYFAAIGVNTGSSTPWCAAFVGFCMVKSNNAKAKASVPKNAPALSFSWQGWGDAVPVNATNIPKGAVVVLIPTEADDRSGHVGFFVKGDADTVTLLGGNQKDSVKESTFSRKRVVAIRWLDVSEPVTADPAAPAGVMLNQFNSQQREIIALIIKRFAEAGFGGFQQIAAVANAWKESSFDPTRRNTTTKEDSVGLFQLNTKGGLGDGRDPSDLIDADKNIDIIIAKCKTVREFRTATTLRAAVAAFVEFVEIPANKAEEIEDRLKKANALVA